MCFLELDVFKNTGQASGGWGPFVDVFTTPNLVAKCVDDDFQDLLDPQQYESNRAGTQFWHHSYSSWDSLLEHAQWYASEFPGAWPIVSSSIPVPAMIQHAHGGDLEAYLETMTRRVDRLRRYLCRASWKIMVWACAVPYSKVQAACKQLRADEARVLQILTDMMINEIRELHKSLDQYGCDHFCLLGVLIIDDAPPSAEIHHEELVHQIWSTEPNVPDPQWCTRDGAGPDEVIEQRPGRPARPVLERPLQFSRILVQTFHSERKGAHFKGESAELERRKLMNWIQEHAFGLGHWRPTGHEDPRSEWRVTPPSGSAQPPGSTTGTTRPRTSPIGTDCEDN